MKARDLPPLGDITVYVDMDGVLVDTYTRIAQMLGVPHYDQITGDQWEKFYSEVHAEDLFSNLDEFSSARGLLDLVEDYAGGYVLLSSPLNYDVPGSIKGKQVWLSKHPHINSAGVIFESNKAQYATTNGLPNVLIDDSPSNINKWEAAGGIGIKYIADKDSLSVISAGLKRAVEEINTRL